MTTINKEEIQKFSKLADEWWDVNGKFKPLHMFNPVRIEYILEEIAKHFKLDKEKKLLLKNLEILDIGCGGGLISEPMARLGGNVTGIDASEKNIKVASPSIITGSYILNSILLNLGELLKKEKPFPFYISSNQKGANKHNALLEKKYSSRNKFLK